LRRETYLHAPYMKIRALPSVIFATLGPTLRILIATFFLLLLAAPGLAHGKSGPTLAVLYFDNNSGDATLDPLSKGFADMLITDLSGAEQVTVVEREKLQALLDESKLQRSKFFDPKTAVKIGKGLGATHVVTGAFITSAPQMRIDVRLIDIATSKVVLGSKVRGPAKDIFDLEQKLVAQFLGQLNLKFFPDDLPTTKVRTSNRFSPIPRGWRSWTRARTSKLLSISRAPSRWRPHLPWLGSVTPRC